MRKTFFQKQSTEPHTPSAKPTQVAHLWMQESKDGCQSEANHVKSEPKYLTQRRKEGPLERSARRTLLDTSRDFRHRSGSSSVKVQSGEGFIYADRFASVQNKRAVSEVPRGFQHML